MCLSGFTGLSKWESLKGGGGRFAVVFFLLKGVVSNKLSAFGGAGGLCLAQFVWGESSHSVAFHKHSGNRLAVWIGGSTE